MSAIRVQGGRPLTGELTVQGAKNSVLPLLAATVLAKGESVLHHCPELTDVDVSLRILQHLGASVQRDGDAVVIRASDICCSEIPETLMHEMRSSVIFLGAVLSRCGEAVMSFPGGCELGPRPIDLHLKALRALGAEIREENGILRCSAKKLRGCELTLAFPSVGATENIMLAAAAAEGNTILFGAAREPEIVDLQHFLNQMGANVRGAGTSILSIEGNRPLRGAEYTVMADRMASATWMCAVASAGGDLMLHGVDCRHLSTVTTVLEEAGCQIDGGRDGIHIRKTGLLSGTRMVCTAPYPGFPTDAQAPMMAALAKGSGATIFVETMFEDRFRHVNELRHMGADIRVDGRVAVVTGVPRLYGADLCCGDLRGGAALLVAALGAEGVSTLSGVHHIDRGYERPEETLRLLGAEIERIS